MSALNPRQEIEEFECQPSLDRYYNEGIRSKSDKKLLSMWNRIFDSVTLEMHRMHQKGIKIPTEQQFLSLWYIYASVCVRLKRIPEPFDIEALKEEWHIPL